MIGFLVTLLLVALFLLAVWLILGIIPGLPPNVRQVVMVIFAIIAVIWLLGSGSLGAIGGGPLFTHARC